MNIIKKLKTCYKIISGTNDKIDAKYQEYWIDGYRFRVIQDFGSTMYNRVVAFQYALKNTDYGMIQSDIKETVGFILSANEKKDTNGVATYANYINASLEEYTPIRVLWEVCNTFILMDGEPTDKLSLEYSQKKKQLCQDSELIEVFFLTVAINTLKAMGNLSEDTQIGDYSRKGQQYQHEKASLKLMQRKIYS